MLTTPLLWMVLTAATVADQPPAQPAARVLKVEGRVTVLNAADESRAAAALDTLYVGERVIVPTGGQVVLAFRSEGRLERLKPGSRVTVNQDGCVPKSAVETVTAPEAHRRTVDRAVRQLQPEGPAAATIVRAPPPPGDTSTTSRPRTGNQVRRPIDGASILTDRPDFAWPAAPKVLGYEFHLFAEGKEVWVVSVHDPRVSYAGEQALQPHVDYIWEVSAVFSEDRKEELAGGYFVIAAEELRQQAAAMEELAAHDDSTFVALAAAWYDENQLIGEAIAAYERLASRESSSPACWSALGRLYQQADREAEAEKAFEKARQLRGPQRPVRRRFFERLRQ